MSGELKYFRTLSFLSKVSSCLLITSLFNFYTATFSSYYLISFNCFLFYSCSSINVVRVSLILLLWVRICYKSCFLSCVNSLLIATSLLICSRLCSTCCSFFKSLSVVFAIFIWSMACCRALFLSNLSCFLMLSLLRKY